MTALRCWQCGVEPTETLELSQFGAAEPLRVVAEWPTADHQHALAPPTPGELAAGGDASRARMVEEWNS